MASVVAIVVAARRPIGVLSLPAAHVGEGEGPPGTQHSCIPANSTRTIATTTNHHHASLNHHNWSLLDTVVLVLVAMLMATR